MSWGAYRAAVVWADGYGRWYAAVTRSATQHHIAHGAILGAIQEREVIGPGFALRIELAPDHWQGRKDGRIVYREVSD